MVPGLFLADGSTWNIVAGDEQAHDICSHLADVMQLRSQDEALYRLFVLTDGNGACTNSAPFNQRFRISAPWTYVPSKEGNTFTLLCPPARNRDRLASQLSQLSLIIAQQTQTRGGFLLHGALIEKNGYGVILAGPGGVGKTTASRRIQFPWCSLSDDATLVVRDENGKYWAHPWPTWSSFMVGGKGGSWDVGHAAGLKAILFLAQAQNDRIEPIGIGHSVPLLFELAEQTSWSMAHGQGGDMARVLRLQRFENICSLAKSMCCYHLHLSLNGAFWEELERVISEEKKEVS